MIASRSVLLFFVAVTSICVDSTLVAGERTKVSIPSSVDGTGQSCYVIVPTGYQRQAESVPLLVSLHSWSGNVEQRNESLEKAADQRGWIYLFPDFRGANSRPEACGSTLAQQDILDAVEWARKNYRIDPKRIYLTGASGGGHMTLLMVGRHPEIWAAASAWVGISDVASWYDLHAKDNYGEMMRHVFGGPPAQSTAILAEYRQRSPLTHLSRATRVPLDIAAGVHDGHQGSVPVRHSLDAFNVIAKTLGVSEISESEITQIGQKNGRLEKPRDGDQGTDEVWGRAYYLRRRAGKTRVTIFEGGHEGITEAIIDWLAQHQRTP